MTQEETLKRIEEDANEYVSKTLGTSSEGVWRRNAVKDFIAGAKSERNEVLDEVETKLQPLVEFGFVDVSWAEIIKILSSLKVDL